jgi:phage nucleotide-binding protein
LELKNTRDVSTTHVKLLVYGPAGAGKTTLVKTLPKVLVLSAEGGLLSLAGLDVEYIEIKSIDDLRRAYLWIKESDDAVRFESVALDSISEIAEVVLSAEKAGNKDPRKAYGEMADQMTDLIRAFRDLPKNVYFSAKMEKTQDEAGRLLYAPSMPGNKVGQNLPYFFDEVLALRVEKNADGQTVRALMTDSDGLWTAKDRSGKLDDFEAPDLGAIIAKVKGVKS